MSSLFAEQKYPRQALEEIDRICDQVYWKTFEEVARYLSRKKPLSCTREEASKRIQIPKKIQFKHAPDGSDVNAMMQRIRADAEGLKTEIEDNVIVSIRHAVSDALCRMNRRERFNGRHKAELSVTEQRAVLVGLYPTSAIPQ